ncbi:MAG: hypothetical protein HGA33_03395 [Candidatus Moranbacteria bacterium]|nr:hypothetical protein [Candidatus Moranbacteria bacterium]
MNRDETTVVSFFLLAACLSIMPFLAFAEERSYSLEPFFRDVTIGSDSSQSYPIIITNQTDQDAVFRVSVTDFGTLDESGGIAFLGGGSNFSERYGLASWMRVDRERFVVPSGSSERVSVTITDRDSLSPGGHYGAVVFEMLEDSSGAGQSDVSVKSSFASLVFVTKYGGEVRSIRFAGTSIADTDLLGIPSKVASRFRNDGNVHLVPRGRVTVTDLFGRVVREGIVNTESGRMLPESHRTYPTSLIFVRRAVFPGPYRVVFEYRYDGQDEFETSATLTTWPIGLIAVWLVGTSGIVFAGIRYSRRTA